MARILIVIDRLESLTEDLSPIKRYFNIELAKTITGLHFDAIIIKNNEELIEGDIFCIKVGKNERIYDKLWSSINELSNIEAINFFYKTIPIFTYREYLYQELVSSLILYKKRIQRKELSVVVKNPTKGLLTVVLISGDIAGVVKVKVSDMRISNIILAIILKEIEDIISSLDINKIMPLFDQEREREVLNIIKSKTKYIASKLK